MDMEEGLMKVYIGSKNKDKIKEIRDILKDYEIVSLTEYPQAPEVIEDKDTITENAVKKAIENAQYTGLLTVADDTGLFVRALNDRPGVYSARYAGESCSYEDNRKKMLAEMKDQNDRYAEFRTVVALADKNGLIATAQGIVPGQITQEEIGDSGFGYDPIFHVNEANKTYAQMSDKEKNMLSHRAKAFFLIKEDIKKYYQR